ncbi:MAG: hypothetical protein LQ346_006094 [Caloplaca aetnensis]|nr:MAG: hypothetical protein LQ346_006094 [Caloplaca aetnensis]
MSNISVSVPLANASTTLDQFYCQNTRDKELSCLSVSQFATSNFDQLCPSGSCLDACQDLERLYAVIPPGMQVQADNYGLPTRIPDMITLYGICLGYANISRALHGAEGFVPAKEAEVLNPLFPPGTEDDLHRVCNGATRCLSETCETSINGSRYHHLLRDPECFGPIFLAGPGNCDMDILLPANSLRIRRKGEGGLPRELEQLPAGTMLL